MKNIILILFTLFISSNIFSQTDFEIVVETDFEGNVISGSIDNLIQEIRKGKPVRVGWQMDFNQDGKPDFEHWVDAKFITILGTHVFTQIETIFMQGPNLEIPQVEIYPISHQWTAVIGTNGKLLNRFIMEEQLNLEVVDENGNKIESQDAKNSINDMTKVDTWKVATFWSVQK